MPKSKFLYRDIGKVLYHKIDPISCDLELTTDALVPRKGGGAEFVEIVPVIKRVQFTAYDRHVHPEIDNDEYLEHELVETGLSSGVCSFGWIEIDTVNDGYKWIKKADIPIGE